MKVLVFNGWAAGPEAWALCAFRHDWVFDYVEQLDGLPEEVMEDSDEVVLVGFSMGGSTALRMLLKYPEKVKGLVLISATPRMMEIKEAEWKGMSERRLAALRLGTQMLFKDDPSPMYREDNMQRGLEYLRNTDLRSELLSYASRASQASRFPVHVFQSEKDGIVRPNNAEFLKRVFPQAKVTLVPGGEHVLPVTVPEQIDRAVRACTPVRAVVSLGSNVEPRAEYLQRALAALAALPETSLLRTSSVIETEPVDVPDEFAALKFLNQAAILETTLDPFEFSRRMHGIEDGLGRVRTVRNGPRTIDIDLIDFGGEAVDTPELVLPHPRAHLRDFVRRPLAELGIFLCPES